MLQGRQHRHRAPHRDEVPRGHEHPVLDEAAPGRLAFARARGPLDEDHGHPREGRRDPRSRRRRQARRARGAGPRAARRSSRSSTRTGCSRCCSSARRCRARASARASPSRTASCPGLDRLLATFARSQQGVDFESIDGQPTHLFFLLVVPEHSGGQHLKALARISRFFRDAAFRKRAAEGESLEDVVARHRGGGREVLTRVQRACSRPLHGALVEVDGVGVLLLGPSGIGKSECALELVSPRAPAGRGRRRGAAARAVTAA